MKTFLMLVMGLCAGVTAFGAAEASDAKAPKAAAGSTATKLKANKALISLADAKSRIDKAIANPAVMKAIMQHLSAEDQKQFVADVNTAIKALPASDAERTAIFVAVNRAALQGAQKGNVATLVAESFATVSPSALPALSDSLSKDLLNRATDASHTYTDEQYIKLGQIVMAKVNPRTEEVDHSDVRSGFAALMFIRGSNTPTPAMIDAFTAMLPEKARETAKNEWFPAALAEGDARNYDSMLAAADVEAADVVTEVDSAAAQPGAEESGLGEHEAGNSVNGNLSGIINLRVPGPVISESLFADIAGASTDPTLAASAANPVYDAVTAPIQYQLPNLSAGDAAGDVATTVEAAHEVIEESKGYQWQSTH